MVNIEEQEEENGYMLDYVDETMAEIRLDWPKLCYEQYNPIPLALEILQGGNAVQNPSSFKKISKKLEKAMDIIVSSKIALTAKNITKDLIIQ